MKSYVPFRVHAAYPGGRLQFGKQVYAERKCSLKIYDTKESRNWIKENIVELHYFVRGLSNKISDYLRIFGALEVLFRP